MQQKQLLREARWAVWLALLYLIGWCGFAYFSSSEKGLFGFPLWFELSCILLPLVFTAIVYLAIQHVYQEINLDEVKDE